MKKLLLALLLFALPSASFAQGPPTWILNGSTINPFQNTMGVALPTNVTGGNKGAGTINAAGLYVNNVAVATTAGSVASWSAGTTGLTPSTATTGAVTLGGVLIGTNGGTGQSSYTIGDLLYASGASTLSKLSDIATGNALISGGVGVAPSWGKIGLTTHVSGILPALSGGTGVANSNTITLGGNFVLSGAFNATFTIPSSSTWAFPSGGGTLAITTTPSASIVVSSTGVTGATAGRLLTSSGGSPVLGEFATTISGSNITFPGNISGNNTTSQVSSIQDFIATATGSFYWSGRGVMRSSADGVFKLTTNAETVGGIINAATDSTFKFFARDGSTRAIMEGGTLTLGGATIGSHVLAVTGSTNLGGTVVDASGNVTGIGNIRAGAGSQIYWNGRSVMQSMVDGQIVLWNNATTDFSRLQFGGTTSSFPSIKRSSATLAFRLADDSADASISTAQITTSSNINIGTSSTINWITRSIINSPSDGVVGMYDNAGTSFIRLNFGPGTSSFPAIKRSSTALAFRLADDSADAPITASNATFSGTSIVLSALPSDAATTNNSVCVTTTTGVLTKGSGTLGVCLGTSSLRYKEKVEPLKLGLVDVLKLQPRSFYYKKGYGDDGVKMQYGFIAEEVVTSLPSIVGIDKEKKPSTVDYMAMVPMLVQAVKELNEEVTNLRGRIK